MIWRSPLSAWHKTILSSHFPLVMSNDPAYSLFLLKRPFWPNAAEADELPANSNPEIVMSQQIKVWKVLNNGSLQEIETARLDLEQRIHDWIEKDISIIADDLLVIRKEVQTDYGGFIDLLCLDQIGNLVIIELKRDKTPREVTAQALDYASWVKDLSNEEIVRIANDYFRNKDFPELEKVFKSKFGLELPEVLNDRHTILIVASEIDNSTERIIDYLSNTYGVGINAITFRYFHTGEQELLARVFLLEPEQVKTSQEKLPSKRKPNPTYEELAEIADQKGVGELYKTMTEELLKSHFSRTDRRTGAITFNGSCSAGKSAVIFSLVLSESNPNNGLNFRLYIKRFEEYFQIPEPKILAFLPKKVEEWTFDPEAGDSWSGYQGFFENRQDVEKFLQGLNSSKEDRTSTSHLNILDHLTYESTELSAKNNSYVE
ncbi:MAG: DUF91 domain-containing protein [Leptolyngbyaceae cyanobacterium SL_5_9]|nr:DUF91 domain-containing protein [Leptolyngbyaceae cyanobacterium SL_5_9]